MKNFSGIPILQANIGESVNSKSADIPTQRTRTNPPPLFVSSSKSRVYNIWRLYILSAEEQHRVHQDLQEPAQNRYNPTSLLRYCEMSCGKCRRYRFQSMATKPLWTDKRSRTTSHRKDANKRDKRFSRKESGQFGKTSISISVGLSYDTLPASHKTPKRTWSRLLRLCPNKTGTNAVQLMFPSPMYIFSQHPTLSHVHIHGARQSRT